MKDNKDEGNEVKGDSEDVSSEAAAGDEGELQCTPCGARGRDRTESREIPKEAVIQGGRGS